EGASLTLGTPPLIDRVSRACCDDRTPPTGSNSFRANVTHLPAPRIQGRRWSVRSALSRHLVQPGSPGDRRQYGWHPPSPVAWSRHRTGPRAQAQSHLGSRRACLARRPTPSGHRLGAPRDRFVSSGTDLDPQPASSCFELVKRESAQEVVLNDERRCL